MVLDSGYKTECYTDSTTALVAFRTDPDSYVALITDQTMSGITGAELVRGVRAIKPGLPVVLITGSPGLLTKQTVSDWGNALFLSKPMSHATVVGALSKVLDASSVDNVSRSD